MTLRLRRKSSDPGAGFTRSEICSAVSGSANLRISREGIDWWDEAGELDWRRLLKCVAMGPAKQPWNHDEMLVENPDLYGAEVSQSVAVPLERKDDLFGLFDQLNTSVDRFAHLREVSESLKAEIVAPNPLSGIELGTEPIAVVDTHETPIVEPAELLHSTTACGGPALVHWNTRWHANVLRDGRIASGGWDETLRVWDPSADGSQVELQMTHDCLISIDQLADDRLVAASIHGELKIFAWPDFEELQVVTTKGAHSWRTFDGGRLMHGDEDSFVLREAGGSEIRRFELGPGAKSLAALTGSKALVLVDWKHGLVVDLDSGTVDHLLPIGPGHPSNEVAIISSTLELLEDSGVLLGLRDSELVAWRNPEVNHAPFGLNYTLNRPSDLQSATANSEWLAVTTDSDLILTPLDSPETNNVYPIEKFSKVQFLRNGKLAIAKRGELVLMDPETGQAASFSGGPAERPSAISEISDDLIAVATVGRPTLVWDRHAQESTQKLDQDLALAGSVVNYEGIYLGSSSWDAKALAFSEDGTLCQVPPTKLRRLTNAGNRLLLVADMIAAATTISQFDDNDAIVVGPSSGTLAANPKSEVLAGLATNPRDRESCVLWRQKPSGKFESWVMPFYDYNALLAVSDSGAIAAVSPDGDLWVLNEEGQTPHVLSADCATDNLTFCNGQLLLSKGLHLERRSAETGSLLADQALGDGEGTVHFTGSLAAAVEHHDRPGLAAVLRVWDLETLDEEVADYTFHRDRPTSVLMTDDNRLLVTLEGRGLAFLHLTNNQSSN